MIGWIIALLLGVFTSPAHAVDPTSAVWQYGHTGWRAEDGELPGAPNALTQTPDGYLWIGTNTGPVRFDGVRFRSLTSLAGHPTSTHTVVDLLGMPDGSLVIGTGGTGEVWNNGSLTRFESSSRVNRLRQASNGDVWFSRTRMIGRPGAIGRLSQGKTQYFGAPQGLDASYTDQFAIASDGSLWLGMPQGLVHWDGKSSRTYAPAGGEGSPSITPSAVEIGPDGSVWVGYVNDNITFGLQHFSQGRMQGIALPAEAGPTAHVQSLLIDREGTVWVGTTDHGIFLLRDGKFEQFSTQDGLSGDCVSGFLEDIEGNVWVTTNAGLDRFRDLRVKIITTREGLSANTVYSVAPATDGSLWVSSLQALDHLQDGHVIASLRVKDAANASRFTRVFADRDGKLWAGVDDGLAILQGAHFRHVLQPDGSTTGVVTDIVQDAAGAVWVASNKGAFRVSTSLVAVPSKLSSHCARLLATADGSVWAETGDMYLARLRGDEVNRFDHGDIHRPATALQSGTDGTLLIGTVDGLVVWKNGAWKTLHIADGLPCDNIYGIAVDERHDVWLSASCGILHLSKERLESWFEGSTSHVKVDAYDAADGAQTGPTPFGNAGAMTSDGQLWFATGSRLILIDPAQQARIAPTPQVHLEELVIDHKRFPTGSTISTGTNPRELEVDYSASGLGTPNRTRFRYKLEGLDSTWHEPGSRREAIYTDLQPGRYLFHVVASNEDGAWTPTGATQEIDVPATWYQTRWFLAACIAAAGLAMLGLTHLRLRQIRARLQAREDERERIARDLHDTLLQGTQGLVLLLHAKVSQLPPTEPLHSEFSCALDRAQDLLREGRNRIRGLRVSSRLASDLFRLLAHEADSAAITSGGTRFEATMRGNDRWLDATTHDELRWIVSEALLNAFQHARATLVLLDVRLSDRGLEVLVCDNGVGFDEATVRSRSDEHWGVVGMRERAARIGARLDIQSRGAGTRLVVLVPFLRVQRVQGWISRRRRDNATQEAEPVRWLASAR